MERAIITSASNKFFPSLINLIGSIKKNYSNHPQIFVYDLGLAYFFKKELEQIPNVSVLKIPEFCSFWRSCYTWKTYILNTPLARLNLYLDAGNQILRPLDEIFNEIENNDYFTVKQDPPLIDIVPKEFKAFINIDDKYYGMNCITAGIFGFKESSLVSGTLNDLYESALAGLCLGFSQGDQWRNRKKDRNYFVRNCKIFRHDTTMLSMFMRRDFEDFVVNDNSKFGGASSPSEHPEQIIWNLRLNYRKLLYTKDKLINSLILHKINRLIINLIYILKLAKQKLK